MVINCIMGTLKTLTRFKFHKTTNKNKKWFCKSCLQCFSNKNAMTNHKENCLSINGAQSVNLEKELIEFKNYCRQINFPFKIYADFECSLEGVKFMKGSTHKDTIIRFFVVLLTKLFTLIIDLVNRLSFLGVKRLLMN